MKHSSSVRRAVITGIGPVTPVGVGREAFWRGVSSGANGVASLEACGAAAHPSRQHSRIAAAVPRDWLPLALDDDRRLHVMADRAFALALEDAGTLEGHQSSEIGVIVGTAVGMTAAMERSFLGMHGLPGAPQASSAFHLMEQVSFHTTAHRMAQALRAKGPALTVSTGCTAGIDAAGLALDLVRSGTCTAVVMGAADAPICPIVYAAFDAIGALSTRNDEPRAASRPFDRDRDGFVLGEGACVLVVEELEHARARGAHIYAEITGYASVSNAFHMTDLPADGAALARCMRASMDDARLRSSDLTAVNAHGSSTPQNDICETNALKEVLGRDVAARVPINSLKSMVGHALGASNAIELAACALSIDHQFAFPTINFDNPGDGCDLDYVPNVGRPAMIDTLLKLSSGFSGIHSALVMAHVGHRDMR